MPQILNANPAYSANQAQPSRGRSAFLARLSEIPNFGILHAHAWIAMRIDVARQAIEVEGVIFPARDSGIAYQYEYTIECK